MPFVYSTATNATTYALYHENPEYKGLNRIKKSVTIAGGSNVAAKRTLYTPVGVGTEVTQDDLDFLLTVPAFQRHIERGFVKVSKDTRDNAEVAAADMNNRDGSAPLVPGDFGPNSPFGENAPQAEAATAASKTKAKKR
jgi:hypothetical protein